MKKMNALALAMSLLMAPALWAQCPTHPEFYQAASQWTTQSLLSELIVVAEELPGWTLELNGAGLDLENNPHLTVLPAIAFDESLTVTLRHWDNACVATAVSAEIASGDGILQRGTDVLNGDYVEVPFTFQANTPGAFTFALVLQDATRAPILEATLSLTVKPLYLLSLDLATGTTGTTTIGDYYVEGEEVAYGFSADDCHENLVTLLDGEPVENSGTIVMDADHELSTTLDLFTYEVTVTSEFGGHTDHEGLTQVACGEVLMVTATPAACSTFLGWSGDASGTENPLTLTNISGDMEITAMFSTTAIEVPDANFKAYLVASFDTDHDGEICPSEALAVTQINCSSRHITDLTGLSFFTNLWSLSAHGNQITLLPDMSNLSQLNSLTLSYNQLTSLPDLSHLTELRYLYLSNNLLTSLPDLANAPLMDTLVVDHNQLTSLPDLSNLTLLRILNCQSNQLTSLPSLSSLTQLYSLYCQNNQLTSLPDLSTFATLDILKCEDNQLTSMPDLSGLTSVRSLHMNDNLLTSVPDVSMLSTLESFRIHRNYLDSGDCPDIQAIEARNLLQFYWNPQKDQSTLSCPE